MSDWDEFTGQFLEALRDSSKVTPSRTRASGRTGTT